MGLTEYGHIATEETQLRVADLLQAIAAGSAGPEYTDATFKALLDDTNTTEIFSAWWPLSAASNDSKYKRLLRFFTMLQTDKTYTVKFPSPAVSTNPEDWAAEDRMTWYIRANAVSLADGTMDVLAIEGEEEFDITGTLAPVYTFAPALLRRVIDDGSYLSKSWRSTLADGFTPYAENVTPNGKRRAMTWHATFPGGLNAKGALTSGAGLPVANFNSAVTGLALARKQTAYDSVWGDCDSLYMLDMWQLRHFNLENSRILEGCTSYNLQYKVAAAETGVKRVLLTASQASGFIVGSTVSVGDKGSNSSVDRYNTWMRDIADKVKVKSIETVTVGGTDYSAVNLDVADSFDVPETAYISSMPWHSGATEALPGHSDGAPGSLTNGKYPCRWAGVEMLNGAYVIGLDPLWNVTTVDGGVTYTAMACRDSEKEAGSVTANHVKVAEKTFTSVNAWNYELSMQNDSTESLLPDKTGGGDTVGMKSAFSVHGSAGVRCPWRYGNLNNAGIAGAACANGNNSPANSNWNGVPRPTEILRHSPKLCRIALCYPCRKLKSCETDTAPGFGRGYALRAHGGASSRTPRPCTKGHGNRKPLHISKYFYETKI